MTKNAETPTAEEWAELKARLALYETLLQKIAIRAIDDRIERLSDHFISSTRMH